MIMLVLIGYAICGVVLQIMAMCYGYNRGQVVSCNEHCQTVVLQIIPYYHRAVTFNRFK